MMSVTTMPSATDSANAPPILPASAALFLDFDGTLAPIAQRPQDVIVPAWVLPVLEALCKRHRGALAIVSGRPLASIDAFLHPLVLCAAGGHGAERRDAQGHIERLQSNPPASVVASARALAAQHSGLLFETKPTGIALHYRLRPELEATCGHQLAQALVEAPGAAAAWEWMHGLFVFELKLRSVSKAVAVNSFLAEPPFAGRLPVFVGDDLTDEDGIGAAQAAGGFGVRVGSAATQARYSLSDTDAVAAWLGAAADSPSS
jgi:trehalose 6-phosphate phosphatase